MSEILSDRAVFDDRGALLNTLSGADSFGPTVAADLDGDGMLEMIYAGKAFHADGSDDFSADSQAYAAVADLDGDEIPEVFLATTDSLLVLEHDGTVRKRVPLPPSSALEGQMTPPLIADFNGDGLPEIADAGENIFNVYRGTDLSLIGARTSIGRAARRHGARARSTSTATARSRSSTPTRHACTCSTAPTAPSAGACR